MICNVGRNAGIHKDVTWITICFTQRNVTIPLRQTGNFLRTVDEKKLEQKTLNDCCRKGYSLGEDPEEGRTGRRENEWRGKKSCKEKACLRLYVALWISLYNVLTIASKHSCLRFSFLFFFRLRFSLEKRPLRMKAIRDSA